jgi:16S rRNA (cytosine967-C5)-methyltransferase
VPYLKRPRDVKLMSEAQDRLLRAAGGMLRAGGRLIYAVCSLQPEEGAARLAGTGLRHDPFRRDELPGLPGAITPEGWLRTHPGMWADLGGMDGFFAGRLVKE